MDKTELIRQKAETDLESFIQLVHPQRVLGNVHRELIQWWSREDASTHQLVLLPRDHQKSALVAYRVAQEITRNPTVRILYVSSTSTLAVKQLKFIKDILTSPIYKFYWPEMINEEEGKREKWTESEISVDHPFRKIEAIRDSTVFTAGLTTSITGLHCDITVLDDVVVQENAYTEEGRIKVESQASLLASIEGTDSRQWVVGTRYHPLDLYDRMVSAETDIYDKDGEVIETKPVYEVFERQVEDRGDGSGQFLWPRQQRYDGKWFGFDQNILAKKKTLYYDTTQFRAQYYNDPNDLTNAPISRDVFQYFDKNHLSRFEGRWYYKGTRLNIFAAVDFAFSITKKADYTAIVVVGVDPYNNIYVLEIDRFRTNLISDYFQHILKLHQKWDFRKIRAEMTSAQQIIVKDLKENYIRPYGLALSIEEAKPNRHEGSKEERINAALQPRYANSQIWHSKEGNTQILEEELVLQHPPHDDVKDCLASVMDICMAPSPMMGANHARRREFAQETHSRFGGIL